MPLKAGKLNDFAGSMAEDMEQAFRTLWPQVMQTPYPGMNEHMKMFFLAIAQGVVRHLVDNADAINVNIHPESAHTHPYDLSPGDATYRGNNSSLNTWNDQYLQHEHNPQPGAAHLHNNNVTIDETT